MKKNIISAIIVLGFSSIADAASRMLDELAVNSVKRVAQLCRASTNSHLIYKSKTVISQVMPSSSPMRISGISAFSFREFSSSATTDLQGLLLQREEKLGTFENDDMNHKSAVFSKAVIDNKMYKDPTQNILSLKSTLAEAGTCVDNNCYKTLKKLGLIHLSEAAKQLSDAAETVLREIENKGNIDSLFYNRPFSDTFSQISCRWSLAIEKDNKHTSLTEEQKDQALLAIHNVYVLRRKLSEIL